MKTKDLGQGGPEGSGAPSTRQSGPSIQPVHLFEQIGKEHKGRRVEGGGLGHRSVHCHSRAVRVGVKEMRDWERSF